MFLGHAEIQLTNQSRKVKFSFDVSTYCVYSVCNVISFPIFERQKATLKIGQIHFSSVPYRFGLIQYQAQIFHSFPKLFPLKRLPYSKKGKIQESNRVCVVMKSALRFSTASILILIYRWVESRFLVPLMLVVLELIRMKQTFLMRWVITHWSISTRLISVEYINFVAMQLFLHELLLLVLRILVICQPNFHEIDLNRNFLVNHTLNT